MRKVLLAAVVALVIAGIGLWYFLTTAGSSYLADTLSGLAVWAEARLGDNAAETLYLKSLHYNPHSAKTRCALAALYEGQGRISASEALLTEGIEAYPSGTPLYIQLAELYTRSGKLQQALDVLDNAPAGYISTSISSKRPSAPAILPDDRPAGFASFSLDTLPGLIYYYTLDGTVPSADSQIYSAPVALESGRTEVRVVAVNASGLPSKSASYTFDINPRTVSAWEQSGGRSICPFCGAAMD